MKQKLISTGLPFLALFSPAIAFAAPRTYADLIGLFLSIINLIIPIVIGIAVVGFMYGVLKYMLSLGNEQEQKSGREIMLWGVVALFLMFTVWGILRVLSNTFLGASGTSGSYGGVGLPVGGEATVQNQTVGNFELNIPRQLP